MLNASVLLRSSGHIWRICSFLVLLAAFTRPLDAAETDQTAAAKVPGQITALLEKHCLDCHGKDSPEADFSLAGIAHFSDREADVWTKVRTKVQLGEMPPEEMPRPSAQEQLLLIDWIAGELKRSGAVVEDKLSLPNYGNYVSHEALFGRKPTLAPASKVRLWRIRPEAYGNILSKQGLRRITQPFSLIPGQQFSDYSVLYTVDESSAEIVLRNAQQLVTLQTKFKREGGKWVKDSRLASEKFLPLIDPDTQATPEQIDEALRYQFQQVLDRDPTEDELKRVTALMEKVTRDVGRLHGVQAALTVPLLMPEAVYRFELGAGELDEHGRRRLSQREIAYAISYALTGDRPHNYNLRMLKNIAEQEKLATREQVAAAVRKVLEEKLDKTPRVLGFFDEYFDYKKAVGVFKEKPSHASTLVRDTETLIRHIVREDRGVFRRLLTTNFTHISREERAEIYGLPPDWKSQGRELVELPKSQRAGILTQPSWLIAHSGNFDNDPVHRGKWVRERLLGGTVPDLPISVDAVVPDDPEKTLRERYSVTKADYCWNCHRRMNPLGMAFESFDHFGRRRTTELKRPVDSHGAIDGSGDAKLDGPVSGAVEMIHRLAQSERVRQVFVRYAFRYFLGRNETVRDAQTLQDADRAYVESSGSMDALIVSLLSSDSFLYRMPDLE